MSYGGLLPNPQLKALPSGMRIMFSQNKNRDVDGLASAIFDSIWAKLSSLTSVKFSPINRDLCDEWIFDSRALGLTIVNRVLLLFGCFQSV